MVPKQDIETMNRLAADPADAGVLLCQDKTTCGRRFDKWSKMSTV